MASKHDFVGDNYYARHLNADAARYAPTVSSAGRSANRADLIKRMLIRQLTELSANRFEWLGFPEEIDTRFLEMTLFHNALAVFFKDTEESREDEFVLGSDTDKYFAMRGSSGHGNIDMYDNPTKFFVTGNQMMNRTIDVKYCVPIWANYMRTPDIDIVLIYAEKLAELDVTIEINTRNARRSKVIVTDENKRMSTANFNKQIEDGQPVLEVSAAMGDPIYALDLGIDSTSLINLSILRSRFWNECMTHLGINNSNQDKKERLVEDEVAANDDAVQANRNVALNARRKACEDINRMFGLNVSVDFHNDAAAVDDDSDDDDSEDDNA